MLLQVRITKHYNRGMDCLESFIEQNKIVIISQNKIEKLITYYFGKLILQ